jgi:hypothetical protein
VLGSFGFSTEGLGITPGNPLSLIQASESGDESNLLSQWFDQQWAGLKTDPDHKSAVIAALQSLAVHRDPFLVYTLILHHLFGGRDDDLDEERIVKSATGIRNTVVWRKLFKFQRDGVIGAIDKLDRFGGCIIADSVGLGKTFEALAIIKYHELRYDRALVLCPKRLRDNWTLYKVGVSRRRLAQSGRWASIWARRRGPAPGSRFAIVAHRQGGLRERFGRRQRVHVDDRVGRASLGHERAQIDAAGAEDQEIRV